MQSVVDRSPAGAGKSTIVSLGYAAFALAALLATGAAAGETAAQALYRQDRAACNSGQSYQDRATCLREAGAALQEAGHKSGGDSQGSYEQNRVKRCEGLPPADREDCLRRMRGEGSVSGSVEGGGLYRELHTTLPAQ
ncbi:MAG: hypothetical protein IH606_10675 [Burkholderiales bacterium]|nr:hypothetical protein [Burkholderiales bacterium]